MFDIMFQFFNNTSVKTDEVQFEFHVKQQLYLTNIHQNVSL